MFDTNSKKQYDDGILTHKGDNKIYPDTNFDTKFSRDNEAKEQILALLRQKPMRNKDIIRRISPLGVSKNKKPSDITVKRALRELIDKNKIIKIQHTKLKEYGLNKKDKRAKYYTLKINEKELEWILKLITSLGSDDEREQKLALRELSEKYLRLNSDHLDKIIIEIIKKKQEQWCTQKYLFALKIVYNHIQLGITPSVKSLGLLLNTMYETIINFYKNMDPMDARPLDDFEIESIKLQIQLLGLFQDKRIIDIAKLLAEEGLLMWAESFLSTWECSKIIQENDTVFYDLQIHFKKNNKIIESVYRIRNKAKDDYEMYKNNFLPIEEALRDVIYS